MDLAEDTTALRRELCKPAFVDVSDDLATQCLLHVGEASRCVENHDTDNEAHDDELDDGCTAEIAAAKHGILYAVSEAKHNLSRCLKTICRLLRRRRWCWEEFVGAGNVRITLKCAALG